MSDSDSDDDLGPRPAPVDANDVNGAGEHARKRARVQKQASQFEPMYLEALPSAEYYEHSYMHRDIVTHVAVSKASEFLITGSCDGHVKFWKKMPKAVEFVKHYQAHLGPLNDLVVSPDEKLLVTTSSDRTVKVFEIAGFDMSNMLAVPFEPNRAVWLTVRGVCDRFAVSDAHAGAIRIYKADSAGQAVEEVGLHASPVRCMAINPMHNAVISADAKGMLEYWDAAHHGLPAGISWAYKSDTSLYSLLQAHTQPTNITISPDGRLFAVTARDKKIRLFRYSTAKIIKIFDEAASVYSSCSALDETELGKRMAVEREVEANPEFLDKINIAFDASSSLMLFSTLRGIKVVSLDTNKVLRVIGGGEKAERFLSIALYQGVPAVDQQLLLARGGSTTQTADEMHASLTQPDPTIFATSVKRRRFYCLSSREPDESTESRDKFNELPTEEERSAAPAAEKLSLPSEVILHTTMGDITIKLFHDVPVTIENFTTHCKNGYYDNIIFHR